MDGTVMTAADYVNFPMSMANVDNNITLTFYPLESSIGQTFVIMITSSADIFAIRDTSYSFNVIVLDKCLFQIIDAPLIQDYGYIISGDPIYIYYDLFSMKYSDCGSV
jgi:hypothetical protein